MHRCLLYICAPGHHNKWVHHRIHQGNGVPQENYLSISSLTDTPKRKLLSMIMNLSNKFPFTSESIGEIVVSIEKGLLVRWPNTAELSFYLQVLVHHLWIKLSTKLFFKGIVAKMGNLLKLNG